MTELSNIKKYFTAKISGEVCRKDIISVRKIEVAAGMPLQTLHDFLNEKKYVHIEKHVDKLVPILVEFGYKHNIFLMIIKNLQNKPFCKRITISKNRIKAN